MMKAGFRKRNHSISSGVRTVACLILSVCTVLVMMPLLPDGEAGTKAMAAETVTVNTESALSSAVAQASTDAGNPTVITVTKDITLTEELEIPEGCSVHLKGSDSGVTLSPRSAFRGAQSSSGEDGTAVIGVKGNLTISTLSVSGGSVMRVMTVGSKGNVTLDDGATVKNGMLGMGTQNEGAGIGLYGTMTIQTGAAVTDNIIKGKYAKNNQYSGSDSSVEGIGIYVGTKASLLMTGGTISENKDQTTQTTRKSGSGGGIYLNGSMASFRMTGGSIRNNTAYGGGGGIYSDRGKVEISGGSVSGNTTKTNGGGIYTLGETSISGGSVTGNKADSSGATNLSIASYGKGGGIFVGASSGSVSDAGEDGGSVKMSGGTISGNTAHSPLNTNPGDLDIGMGGGVYVDAKMTMTGGSITGNTASATASDSEHAGSGGGISVRGGDDPAELELHGGSIENNTATGKGEDLFLSNSDTEGSGMSSSMDTVTTEEACRFEVGAPDGNATFAGHVGNLYLQKGNTLSVTGPLEGLRAQVGGDSLSEGTVIGEPENEYEIMPSDAGALTDADGKRTFKVSKGRIVAGTTVPEGTTDLSGASVSGISDQTYTGSAIRPAVSVMLDGTKLTEREDYQISFRSNKNAGTALAIVEGTGQYTGTIKRTFRIHPKNVSELSISDIGEKVYTGTPVVPLPKVKNGSIKLQKDTDYTFNYENNTTVGTAGITITGKGNYTGSRTVHFSIVSDSGKTIVSDESSLKAALQEASGSVATTIYVRGEITLRQTLLIASGTSVSLTGIDSSSSVTAAQSMAASGTGGTAMFDVRGALSLSELTLNAKGRSGVRVLTIGQGGSASLHDDAVLAGGAAREGRGVYNSGTLMIDGGSIRDCDAAMPGLLTEYFGGAVYNAGTLQMKDGSIEENMSNRGGGIYNAKDATAELRGGTIEQNKATGSDLNNASSFGGGVDNAGSMTLSGAIIQNNTSTEFGGGIANTGTLTIALGTIRDNTAGKNGGGIYTLSRTVLSSGTISGNSTVSTGIQHTAACGGGVFVAGGSFLMNGGTVRNNLARSRYNRTDSYASLGNGGGVYVGNNAAAPCRFVMNGGTIQGNTARAYIRSEETGNGGGVFVQGGGDDTLYIPGSFSMNGGTITENKAFSYGDGAFIGNSDKGSLSSRSEAYSMEGAASFALSGGSKMTENQNQNLCLTAGTEMEITGALAGVIGVTALRGGDAVIAEGSDGYTLTDSDLSALHNDGDARSLARNEEENTILLKGIDLSSAAEMTISGSAFTYDGKAHRPAVTVRESASGKTLAKGTDYTVSYDRDAISAGTHRVAVYGDGIYSGSFQQTYTIRPANLSGVSVRAMSTVWNGTAIRYVPAGGAIRYHGVTLLQGQDFVIDTSSYKNNRNIGRASVILRGTGNYTGAKTISFTILPKRASLKSVSSRKKGRLTIKWKKDSHATGYEIHVARNKKFTKGKRSGTVKKYSKKGKTFNGLSKKKTYYVRIRTYKKTNTGIYYGAWSEVKSRKTK